MKNRLLVLLVLLGVSFVSTSLFGASEVKFYGPTWDNLSIPLGITPFYLEVKSSQKAKQVGVKLEVYRNGEFVTTISTGGLISANAVAIDLKCAIYFVPKADPKEGYTVVCSTTLGAGRSSITRAVVTLAEVDFTKSNGHSQMAKTLSGDKKTPVFMILGDTDHFMNAETPEAIIKGNPKGTVIIGYLEKE